MADSGQNKEIRYANHFVFFLTGGATVGLVGGDYANPISNDCGKPYCSNSVGAVFPQGRIGVGVWL